MPIIVDLIMIGLLVGVIIYTTRLSRSLNNFKSLHAEMSPLLRDHIHSISSNLKNHAELKRLADDVNQTVTKRTEEYKTAQEDLQFLYDRAMTACDRLENLIAQERHITTTTEPIVASELSKILNEKKTMQLHADRDDQPQPLHTEKPSLTLETFSMKKTAAKLLRKHREKNHAA